MEKKTYFIKLNYKPQRTQLSIFRNIDSWLSKGRGLKSNSWFVM